MTLTDEQKQSVRDAVNRALDEDAIVNVDVDGNMVYGDNGYHRTSHLIGQTVTVTFTRPVQAAGSLTSAVQDGQTPERT